LDRKNPLVTFVTSELLALAGVGVEPRGSCWLRPGITVTGSAWRASFARLCGAAPIPVSSGRIDRHRLHRGGDRQANSALRRIALVRMGCHQETKDYVARRTAVGKTKTEIMRCLKREIAREVFPHLIRSVPAEPSRQPGLRQSAC
jgi:transposase